MYEEIATFQTYWNMQKFKSILLWGMHISNTIQTTNRICFEVENMRYDVKSIFKLSVSIEVYLISLQSNVWYQIMNFSVKT